MRSRTHLERVAGLPCCVCGSPEVQVHHLVGAGTNRGMGKKASDFLTIPLCYTHHATLHAHGVTTWEMRHGSQWDHWDATIQRLLYD